jgi:hypothetical protein
MRKTLKITKFQLPMSQAPISRLTLCSPASHLQVFTKKASKKVKIFVGYQIMLHPLINPHSRKKVDLKWMIREQSRVDERFFQVKTDELDPTPFCS